MGLAFIYDMTMTVYQNNYSNYMFDNNLLDLYKEIDEDVSLCCYYLKVDNKETLNSIKGSAFHQVELKNMKSINFFDNRNSNYRILTDAIKQNEYIIIRAPSFIASMAKKICEKENKKYIIELVGCPFDSFWNHSMLGKFIAPFMYCSTKKLIKYSENVFYVTNEFLQKRYPCKNNVFVCSDVNINQLKKPRNWRTKKIIKLCTIANVNVKYKGQEYVIKALSDLNANSEIKYHYYLIGGGNEKRLKKLCDNLNVSEYVHFLGSASHDQIFKLLDEMDIYVQPSLLEGLPRTVIEAMSRGIPVCGTNCGGIPELCNKKMLFNKKNIREIVNVIKCLNNEQLYNEMCIHSIKVAENYIYNDLRSKKIRYMKTAFNRE